MSLYIDLPVLNEDWVEQNLVDLSVAGNEEFGMTPNEYYSEQFSRRWDKAVAEQRLGDNRFVDVELAVMEKIPKLAKIAFGKLWGKKVRPCQYKKYNKKLVRLRTWIGDEYARQWAIQLRCRAWWK